MIWRRSPGGPPSRTGNRKRIEQQANKGHEESRATYKKQATWQNSFCQAFASPLGSPSRLAIGQSFLAHREAEVDAISRFINGSRGCLGKRQRPHGRVAIIGAGHGHRRRDVFRPEDFHRRKLNGRGRFSAPSRGDRGGPLAILVSAGLRQIRLAGVQDQGV